MRIPLAHIDYLVTAMNSYGIVNNEQESQTVWPVMVFYAMYSGAVQGLDSLDQKQDEAIINEVHARCTQLSRERGYKQTDILIFPEQVHKALREYGHEVKRSKAYANSNVDFMLFSLNRAVWKRAVISIDSEFYKQLPRLIVQGCRMPTRYGGAAYGGVRRSFA